jgi:hypothetical protein
MSVTAHAPGLRDPGTPSPAHGLPEGEAALRLVNQDLRGKEVALSECRPLALLEGDIREAGATCVVEIGEGESSSATLNRLEIMYGQHGYVCSEYSRMWTVYEHVTRYVLYSAEKEYVVMLEKRVGKGKWDYKYYYEKCTHKTFLDIFNRSEGRRCIKLLDRFDPFVKSDKLVTVRVPCESVSSSSSSSSDPAKAPGIVKYVRRPAQVEADTDPLPKGASFSVDTQLVVKLLQKDMVLVVDTEETKGNHSRHCTLLEYLWQLTDDYARLNDVPPADAYRHLLQDVVTKAPEGVSPWRKFRDDVERLRCPVGTIGYALVWCDENQSVIVTRLSEAGRMEHYQWDRHLGKPLTLTFVRDLLGRFVYKCHHSRGTWVSFF